MAACLPGLTGYAPRAGAVPPIRHVGPFAAAHGAAHR
jgi:hypothetical protein